MQIKGRRFFQPKKGRDLFINRVRYMASKFHERITQECEYLRSKQK